MPVTADDLHDHLIDTIVDHVLTAPDVSLVTEALRALEQVDGLSVNGIELGNDETGDNNQREVRSLDRDLDAAKSAVKDLAASVLNTVLAGPFEKAVTTARDAGIPIDRWDPDRWLERFSEHAPEEYQQAVHTVVAEAAPGEAQTWYTLVNQNAPRHASMGNLWMTALGRRGASDERTRTTVGTLIESYLADDQAAEPLNVRAKDDTHTSVRGIKLQALHKEAFWAYYNQNSSALQAHVWAHHGMDMGRLDWSKVVDGMLRELRRNGDWDFLQPLPEDRLRSVTSWVTRLTDTGHLDAWLANPDQWTAVSFPQNGSARPPVTEVKAWIDQHAKAGTFTWSVLVAGMEALNQPALALEFRRLGERWSLAHEVALVQGERAPVVRERSRL